MGKRVVVTGAAGLLGGNLVRKLVASGYAVTVIDHPDSDLSPLAHLALEQHRVDLADPGVGLASLLAGTELVFHCAAVTDLRAPASLMWAVNHQATERLGRACLQAGVQRLLFVGSASVFNFGPAHAPGDERSPFPAVYRGMAYMESKHAAMQCVRDLVEEGLDAVILAPTFMLGCHDPRPSSGELIQRYIQRPLRFVSPGGRNFVHVDDVVAGMIAAIDKGRCGETYLLGGTNLSYLDFFRMVATQAGVAPPVGVLPAAVVRMAGAVGSLYQSVSGKPALLDATLARLACYQTCYSPARAVEYLGMPQTPIQLAIADSIASLLAYGHLAADTVHPATSEVLP